MRAAVRVQAGASRSIAAIVLGAIMTASAVGLAASPADKPSSAPITTDPATGQAPEPSPAPETSAGATADEPDATSPADEPEGTTGESSTPADEPSKPEELGESSAPARPALEHLPEQAGKPQVQYGVGLELRAMFVPTWLLNLFLDASTPLTSAAFGAEFVRRKGNFDIIGSIDFGFYSPRDGNYLGNGDDPATETDYVHFDGLDALSFAVHFLRHEEILPWLSFVWGGGVGLSVVLGNIYRASSAGCNKNNLGNLDACHPDFPDYSSQNGAWLKNGDNYGSKGDDSVAHPKIFEEGSVPPVVPLVHLLVGFDFKITDLFSVRVDGGFRNAFYVGTAGHYFF